MSSSYRSNIANRFFVGTIVEQGGFQNSCPSDFPPRDCQSACNNAKSRMRISNEAAKNLSNRFGNKQLNTKGSKSGVLLTDIIEQISNTKDFKEYSKEEIAKIREAAEHGDFSGAGIRNTLGGNPVGYFLDGAFIIFEGEGFNPKGSWDSSYENFQITFRYAERVFSESTNSGVLGAFSNAYATHSYKVIFETLKQDLGL